MSTSWTQPKIKIPIGTNFEFGDVYQGAKITREIVIANIGTSDLLIDHVGASCGCTTSSLGLRKVHPGDSTTLSITFDSKNFSGSVRKSVTIVSNDSLQHALIVDFHVNVLHIFTAIPGILYFGNVNIGAHETRQIRLINSTKTPVTILDVSDSTSIVEGYVNPQTVAPGDTTTLTVWVKPAEQRAYSGEVEIKTTNRLSPSEKIKYFVQGIKN